MKHDVTHALEHHTCRCAVAQFGGICDFYLACGFIFRISAVFVGDEDDQFAAVFVVADHCARLIGYEVVDDIFAEICIGSNLTVGNDVRASADHLGRIDRFAVVGDRCAGAHFVADFELRHHCIGVAYA